MNLPDPTLDPRERRAAAGWTLARLAREIGVHPSAISYWETGQRTPRPPARAAWERALRKAERAGKRKAS